MRLLSIVLSVFVLLFAQVSTSFIAIDNAFAQDGNDADELIKLLEWLDETDWWNNNEEEDTADDEDHNAAQNLNALDDLDEDKWSYAAAEAISVTDIQCDMVTVKTTQVRYDGNPVSKYKVYYSNNPLATLANFDAIKDVDLSPTKTENNMVFLDLKGLDESKQYYIVVAPVHPTDPTADPLSMISEETRVTTKRCPAPTNTAAGNTSDKVFNNVSYTYEDGMVKLTWSPAGNATTAQIELRHQSEGSYTKVGSPAVQSGTFQFAVEKSGNYFLKMTPLNNAGSVAGKEHIQTVKITEVTQPTEEEVIVQKAPQVGPKENIMVGLIAFAVVFYFIYRFRRIEK